MEYGITLSSIETTDGDTDRDKIPPMLSDALLILFISMESHSMPARAGEKPLKKGEKCHQVLCRIEDRGSRRRGKRPNADERRKTK